ncbi:MAG TPA: biopolymer transporter ExbD [Oligoflexia bacterium]|nr:biopolymer transporter ExbD [Oligoflexia bacterium]HMR24035.1 biopolymer transporter ExbD [Oligoflexia bacterium]
MAMQINDNNEGLFEINITPFVDVVLVLLVIFMVTAPMMVQQALEVNLPKTSSADAIAKTTLSVGITANNQYLLNGKLMTLQEIKEQAQKAFEQSKDVQVIFAADLDSKHEAVVMAMDSLRQIGIIQFAFQVIKQE